MIAFQKIRAHNAQDLRAHLEKHPRENCEYSFVNLSIWGRQEMAFVEDFLVLFSQFDRKSLYPFPLGSGDVKPVLDALIADAHHRGLLFRLGCMTKENCALLESLYPGKFQFHEVDAPSGTAHMLFQAIRQVRPDAVEACGRAGEGKRKKQEIGIASLRMGNVVGVHEVHICTPSQSLVLRHEAGTRAMLAEGAVDAARFMVGKPVGLYTMEELLEET